MVSPMTKCPACHATAFEIELTQLPVRPPPGAPVFLDPEGRPIAHTVYVEAGLVQCARCGSVVGVLDMRVGRIAAKIGA
jgi:hypothetical protein